MMTSTGNRPTNTERRTILERGEAALDPLCDATAEFSPCRRFRYALTRVWQPKIPPAVFIMLNPSTADAFKVDPTVRRCINFAHRWGAGGLTVLNLFGYRATDPATLSALPPDALIGRANDQVIGDHLARPLGRLIVAWGAWPGINGRDAAVADLIRAAGHRPLCLGKTRSGAPAHPLYRPAEFNPIPWNVP